jgi:hypothetical protein
VTLVPGGLAIEMMFALIFAGEAEQAWSAARKATFAASSAVPSKPVYGFAPVTCDFQ